MIALNFISLLLISIIFVSLFRNEYIKAGLSLLFGIFFCLQISSLYIGNSFIDYKYYVHFNTSVLSMSGGFKTEIVLFFFLLIAVPLLIFFAGNFRIFKNKRFDYTVRAVIFVASLLVLIVPKNGVYNNLKEIYDIVSVSQNKDFDEFVNELGFTRKENLEASFGGKNIIIVSIESFEKAFLHEKNKELTPNLRKRKENWTFYEMRHSQGSGWTAGSLYTVFTGLPSFFIGGPNSYFHGAKENKLISFGDILNHCGYESYYLANNVSFAGTRDILTIFGIDHIFDGTFGGKYENSLWGGAFDKDIFAEAKEILEKRTSQKPFMLFISTLQTHSPGIPDDRMLQLVERKETDLETAILSTDWLVEDFISFLESKNLLENTVVYLFPDHLLMGEKEIIEQTGEKRGLWFMTNADKNDLCIDPANFYQIDLLPNILSGANIKHNVKFLSDFIEKEKNEFIRENRKMLAALNTSALMREKTIGENLHFKLNDKKLSCVINQDTLFVRNTDSMKDANLFLFLSKELNVLSEQLMSDEEFKDNFYDYYCTYIKISVKNNAFHFEWIRDDVKKYVIRNVSEIKLDQSQVANILKQIVPDKTDNVNNALGDDNAPYEVIRNTTEITDDSFVDYLSKVLENPSRIVMISCYEDGSTYFEKLRPVMERVKLEESLTGKFGWSYFAVFSNREIYCEKTAENAVLHKKLVINDIPVYLTSAGAYSFGQKILPSTIIVDDKKYTLEKRGLNVVIFDSEKREVVDAFNVDAHEDETLKIQRF